MHLKSDWPDPQREPCNAQETAIRRLKTEADAFNGDPKVIERHMLKLSAGKIPGKYVPVTMVLESNTNRQPGV
jgi:hypothetical protein